MSKKIKAFLILACLFGLKQRISAEEEQVFYPHFRSGHNVSFFSSLEKVHWRVSSSQINPAVTSVNESRWNYGFFIRYNYQINILNDYGFFLGSTAGVVAPSGHYGASSFEPSYGLFFPTAMGGVVKNFGGFTKLMGGAEYGSVWYPNMSIVNQQGGKEKLGAIPSLLSIFGELDYFSRSGVAFSGGFGVRHIFQPCLNSCNDSQFLNSFSLQSQTLYGQIGAVFEFSSLSAF